MSPRVLSLQPTCVVLPQLACSQLIQIWGPLTGNQRLKTLSTLSSVNVSGTTVPLTTQIQLLGVTLDQSLSIHTSQLSLNPVSTTSGQFWVKTQPISSPALLSLPGWIVQMHACSAYLSRIYLEYREFKTRLLVSSHAPDLGSALPLCWNTSTSFQSQPAFTSKLPYSLSSHSTP